MEDGSGE
jgi:hypothetical protein